VARANILAVVEYVNLVNQINDHLDAMMYIGRYINPNDGGTLQVSDTMGGPLRAAVFADAKLLIGNELSSINTVVTMLNLFESKTVPTGFSDDMLNYCGETLAQVHADYASMVAVANTISAQYAAASSDADLTTMANYIENNVTRLILPRRAWAIP